MIQQAIPAPRTTRNTAATLAHVAPFAVFVGIMGIEHALGIPAETGYPVRVAAAVLALLFFSRSYIPWKPSVPAASVVIGAAVFVVWIAPDVLFGYRHFWLFENPLTGSSGGVISPALQHDSVFLTLRAASSTLLVPIIEELFWRSWLMRWLIDSDFQRVKLGTYVRSAFWLTAILFASEHGSYWEVGLAAGVIYNWWLIRTRNLADCMLAHAVTNGLLAVYVLVGGHWQYWL